ncbi:MAG: radical SAM protein [Desulfobaccales bacterium]
MDKHDKLGLFFQRLLTLLRHPRLFRNRLRQEFRQRWGIPWDRRFGCGRSGPPVTLTLDLTRRCNLKCLMCTQHRGPAEFPWEDPDQELPLSTWTGLLDQAVSFRPQIYITGGEPTLYRDFQHLIVEAKRRGLPVHLQTNGTRLNQIAEFLVTEGVEKVTVSLDGPGEIHDLIRGQKGVYRRATAGIAALVEARKRLKAPGPIVLINCTISKANLAVLDQMVSIALDLGADILGFQQTIFNSLTNVAQHNLLMPSLWTKFYGTDQASPFIPEADFYHSEIGTEDLPLLLDRLREAVRLAQGRLKLSFLPNQPLDQLKSYYTDLNYPTVQKCNALWQSCHILPDGTVSPCLHVVAGNITKQPFNEIWNGPQMQSLRKIITRRLLPGCARCCLRSFS